MRLLDENETKLEALRKTLADGEAQIDRGEFVDGESFLLELIAKRGQLNTFS